MKQPVLLAVLALAGIATAQGRGPLPGIPMTPPPVDHPALGNQPFFQPERSQPAPPPPPAPEEEKKPKSAPKPVDPATVGPKLGGKELKKAVKGVASLPWHEKLSDAKAESAASGKPILLVQALGEIDGFA